MSDKKNKILTTALRLFANHGYDAVSTAKIAKRSRVSEALIFKHYKNKISLLDAVVSEGQEKFKLKFADIILEQKPQILVSKYIDLAFKIRDQELNHWKLAYKLRTDPIYKVNIYNKPILEALSKAFKAMKIKDHTIEAQLLMHTIDGIFINLISGELKNKTKLKTQLKKKYKL